YRKGGDVTATLEAEVLGAPVKQVVALKFADRIESNPQIDRMWAWHRVQRIMAGDRENGLAASSKDEVVRLCEGYSIGSEYASFIVLENDAEYQRWSIKRRNAARIERDRTAQVALRQELDRMRERAAAKLGPAPDAERGTQFVSAGTSQSSPSALDVSPP